jgi:F0F1-type ATP synthase delta subunit
MNPEFSIFGSAIIDTKFLYRLIDKLSEISSELYHNKEGYITEKVGSISPSLAALFNTLAQKGYEPVGDAKQKEYLEKIIKYLRSLPIVKITLAFEPDSNFSNRLNEVISGLVGEKVVLDLSIDHRLIAGLKVEYKGKFADYSFETRSVDFLRENVPNFLQEKQAKLESPLVK